MHLSKIQVLKSSCLFIYLQIKIWKKKYFRGKKLQNCKGKTLRFELCEYVNDFQI